LWGELLRHIQSDNLASSNLRRKVRERFEALKEVLSGRVVQLEYPKVKRSVRSVCAVELKLPHEMSEWQTSFPKVSYAFELDPERFTLKIEPPLLIGGERVEHLCTKTFSEPRGSDVSLLEVVMFFEKHLRSLQVFADMSEELRKQLDRRLYTLESIISDIKSHKVLKALLVAKNL